MVAARNLGSIYGSIGKSIEKLSSGLRINKAADDAAGLAVREMMRADIATNLQGIRNAADAVSMIQTADGALAVIDAKLVRMKELAEQAATGTYTDFQREIINSEFQAMATEIDRIANATNFNGLRLLDGSLSTRNAGKGIRIHFGIHNNAAEDYYYVLTGDVRASTSTGLNVGGDDLPDIWSTGGKPQDGFSAANCCGGSFSSMKDQASDLVSGGLYLAFNWDRWGPALADNGSSLITAGGLGRHMVGRYGSSAAGYDIGALISEVNKGSQSRVEMRISGGSLASLSSGSASVVCLGTDEMYYLGNQSAAVQLAGGTTRSVRHKLSGTGVSSIVSGINTNSLKFWAAGSGETIWVFNKSAGNFDNMTAGFKSNVTAEADKVFFTNLETGDKKKGLGQFSLGGRQWIKAVTIPSTGSAFDLAFVGQMAGGGHDIKIVKAGDKDFLGMYKKGAATADVANSKIAQNALEVQDASDGRGSVRRQEAAQKALETVSLAIERKDRIRANLGAMQNRLEATMENLTLQGENLQASESRISDVDVANEMTEYTKNNILAQAAASMLAQANSLSTLALTLIRG
jgi:flagellin